MEYIDFINNKQKQPIKKGVDVPLEELNNVLFDFQKACVKKALVHKVFCLFEACGLGKTIQQLEWAHIVSKHTNKPVLVVAPLGVTTQTAYEEAPLLGYKVTICRSDKDIEKGINIINYEILENIDTSIFGGVVLDESSILKNFMGSTRIMLKNKFMNTEYKLCCSATPAPNDLTELLNHADFLGILSTAQARAKYFVNDMKTGDWRLKGHATKAFWKWCCTWSINIESPADLGFDATRYELPTLNENTVVVKIDEIDETFENGMFREIQTSATSFHKEKSRTALQRVIECRNIVDSRRFEQFIIWCDTNQEADLLMQYIPYATEVRGNTNINKREKIIQEFKNGDIKVLISKPKIFGYGMNFQKCHNMIFCGLTYSYENYYQALRRIYRFGQKEEVHSWIVIGSTELHILDVVNKKKKQQENIKNNMDISIKDIQLQDFRGNGGSSVITNSIITLPKFI